jgi:hypothetical protein
MKAETFSFSCPPATLREKSKNSASNLMLKTSLRERLALEQEEGGRVQTAEAVPTGKSTYDYKLRTPQ